MLLTCEFPAALPCNPCFPAASEQYTRVLVNASVLHPLARGASSAAWAGYAVSAADGTIADTSTPTSPVAESFEPPKTDAPRPSIGGSSGSSGIGGGSGSDWMFLYNTAGDGSSPPMLAAVAVFLTGDGGRPVPLSPLDLATSTGTPPRPAPNEKCQA